MSTQTMDQREGSVRYWVVFAVLAIFTGLEVVVGYLAALPQAIRIAVLIFLAVVKVALVLLYFMHLRFDSRLFALPFGLGLVLAIPIILIISITMKAPINTGEKEAQAVNAAVNATGQVIDVKEVSFQINFSQYNAQAGPITFHIVNGADDMLHEFILIQSDASADELPTDEKTGRVNEDAVTIITAAEDIPPSQSRNITVNLAAGHYVIVCNLPGHYEQGMRVDFNVTGTSNEPPSTPESTAAPTEAPTQPPAATPGS
ncbi:MAG TPA: cytochrome C oxidase subunit IV family protein [Anaerolineales bacterium]|nr:cytochrome C oxidase subunit IV family protein [Anaerolineales bacterium]